MRRIILPLRERAPRRLCPIALCILAFLWIWLELQFTYEIVEIDDGSAPAAGPYTEERTIDGRRIAATAAVNAAAPGEPRIVFLEPYRTWMTRVTVRFPARGESGARPVDLFIDGEFPIFRRCIAIVRWKSGVAQTEGCRQLERWPTYFGFSIG